jgi:hypothetical protein
MLSCLTIRAISHRWWCGVRIPHRSHDQRRAGDGAARPDLHNLGHAVQWPVRRRGVRGWRTIRHQLPVGADHQSRHAARAVRADARRQHHGRSDRQRAASTHFDAPASLEAGPAHLVVVANGIPPTPVVINGCTARRSAVSRRTRTRSGRLRTRWSTSRSTTAWPPPAPALVRSASPPTSRGRDSGTSWSAPRATGTEPGASIPPISCSNSGATSQAVLVTVPHEQGK